MSLLINIKSLRFNQRSIIFLCFFVLIQINQVVIAQDSLDFNGLQQILIKNNPTLKFDSLDYNLSYNNLLTSKSSRLPDLNLNVYNALNNGRSLDPITYQYAQQNFLYNTYALKSSINLFNGGNTINTIDKYQYDVSIKYNTFLSDKINLLSNLYANYAEISMLNELESLYKIRLANLNEFKKIIDQRVSAEKITRSSLNLVDIDINTLNEQLNNIIYKKLITEYKIQALIGLKNDSTFKFKYIHIDQIDSCYYTSFQINEISKNSISSKLSEDKVNRAFNDIQLFRGYRYPTLTLGGTLGSGYSSLLYNNALVSDPWETQIHNNQYQSVFLNLYIPIFNKFANKYNIQNSKLVYLQNIERQTENNLQLTDFLNSQNITMLNNYKNFKSSAKSLNLFNDFLFEATQNFESEKISMYELLSIQQKGFTIQESLIISKYHFLIAQKNIELLK